MVWNIAMNDIQGDAYAILALLLQRNAGACRNVTLQKKEMVQ
jgi:hypothetical protein